MKVGFDTRTSAGGHRGVGTYATNLARALLALPSQHEFVFYVSASDRAAPGLASERSVVVEVPPSRLPGRSGRVWASLWPPRGTDEHLDVLLQTDLWLAPVAQAPTVGVVYDLIPLVEHAAQPSSDWPLAERVLVRTAGAWVFRRGLRRMTEADHLIAISEWTRQQLLSECPEIEGSRVSVTHLAAHESFVPVDPAQDLATLGVASPYVLYVGGVDPRKNVAALVRAFELVHARRPDLSLVLAGQEFLDQRLVRKFRAQFATIDRSPAADAILRPGYVDHQSLQALYSGAECFVMPSLHEGFGIPVLEAMRCRCPVIASANSAQPEVVGDAGLLVAPEPDALAAAIDRVLSDDGLRTTLKDRGQRHAATFSWADTATRTLTILEQVSRAHTR